jgi:hypothetical protein
MSSYVILILHRTLVKTFHTTWITSSICDNVVKKRIYTSACHTKVKCCNPTFGRVGGWHTPEMGTWESARTPRTSEFDFRGQNTLHWCVYYITGKILKRRCWKWAHMSHLDIFSTSYDKKKGQESNWQFDSRPLKVGNRSDPSVCRWTVTHRHTVGKLLTRATTLL